MDCISKCEIRPHVFDALPLSSDATIAADPIDLGTRADYLIEIKERPVKALVSATSIATVIEKLYPLPAIAHAVFLRAGTTDVYRLACVDRTLYYARLNVVSSEYAGNGEYLSALLRHAEQRGAPVSRPITTHDGMPIVNVLAADGVRELSLYRHKEGVLLPDTAYAAETGATLARFHQACENYEGPPSVRTRDIDAIVGRVSSAVVKSRYIDDAVRKIYLTITARLEHTLRGLNLTTGHCHHD